PRTMASSCPSRHSAGVSSPPGFWLPRVQRARRSYPPRPRRACLGVLSDTAATRRLRGATVEIREAEDGAVTLHAQGPRRAARPPRRHPPQPPPPGTVVDTPPPGGWKRRPPRGSARRLSSLTPACCSPPAAAAAARTPTTGPRPTRRAAARPATASGA